MEDRTIVDRCVGLLLASVSLDGPNGTMIDFAKALVIAFDRHDLPDWVEALANVNILLWRDGIDEVRRMIEVESVESDETPSRPFPHSNGDPY
jgi:hypothetical protein